MEEEINESTKEIVQNEKSCRWCQKTIAKTEKICHHCGQDQNPFFFHVNRWAHFILLVNLLILVFNVLVFTETKKEKIAVQKALQQAEEAKRNVMNASVILTKLLLFQNSWSSRWGSEESYKYSRIWVLQKSKELMENLNISREQEEEIFRYYKMFETLDSIPEKNKEEIERSWNAIIANMKNDVKDSERKIR